MNRTSKAYLCPIIVGVILIIVGIIIQMPGGALTTFELLDGESTEQYVFDNKYSAIDEYVGGDAYNFIIGASLVAGKISGTMTTKAIMIVSGVLCVTLGLTLMLYQKNRQWESIVSVQKETVVTTGTDSIYTKEEEGKNAILSGDEENVGQDGRNECAE